MKHKMNLLPPRNNLHHGTNTDLDAALKTLNKELQRFIDNDLQSAMNDIKMEMHGKQYEFEK
jgi:hypothetical protein